MGSSGWSRAHSAVAVVRGIAATALDGGYGGLGRQVGPVRRGLFGELGEGGTHPRELGDGELGPFVLGAAGQVRVERARDHPGETAEDLPELLLLVLDPVRSSENT